MTVDVSKTPFGHSLPPEGPHTITFHIPGWSSAAGFRDGDMTISAQIKSLYPRFSPFGPSHQLVMQIASHLKTPEGRSLVPFLSPEVWTSNKQHATSEHRKDKRMDDAEMKHHVVDVAGTRLFLVELPAAKMMGGMFMWQHGGLGISTRLGEHLLSRVEHLKYLGEFPLDGDGRGVDLPSPTYLPEVESHALLRQRIAGLVMRACVEEPGKAVQPDDVYLFQTGMAGIVRFHEAVMRVRQDPVVVFGAVFHSSWHLFRESAGGMKHYGKCDRGDLEDFERYLEGGGSCSYVFTEFPSNPILVSVGLVRLRKLADKYDFFLAVDDTISSFCNIDLLPAADAIITSLTKSFSGYADVMAGSVVLNPNASSYETLKPLFTETFHNELFAGDADKLLKNSDDYLARSAVLNRNAATLTRYFQSLAKNPSMPVKKVCYPPYSPGSENLTPFLRMPTPEHPDVGYGCLFSVEFETVEQAMVFYDNLGVHQGPHLGAHLTLALPYNYMIYGKFDPEYHASYGISQNQIRFSAGLEDEHTLVAVCQKAITAVLEKGLQVKDGGDLEKEMMKGENNNDATEAVV